MKRFRLLLLVCVLIPMAVACGDRRPNVLLVTFDTTRWDHAGPTSRVNGLTPNVDALAARGAWFSTCFASQPVTLPSHTTILTGLYPFNHGVRNNGTYIASDELLTLAEVLGEHGYATHAVVSSFVLDGRFGLDQGFVSYDDDMAGGREHELFRFQEIQAERTAGKAVEWLDSKRPADRPFFLWVHFFDPHAGYHPPAEIAARFPDDRYAGEVHYVDRELGRLLSVLDQRRLIEETLVVVTADHGEGLQDHGESTHGLFVYDSTIRVPLVMTGPKVPEGRRVDGVARTVDIMPTVLDLAGLPVPDGLDGRSLRSLWQGEDGDREVYMETFIPRLNHGWAELRALRGRDLKVVRAPRPEVYDLVKDPDEKVNLVEEGGRLPERARVLLARLDELAESDPFTRGGHLQQVVDKETQGRLAALGYVVDAATEAGFGNDEVRPDPKDRVGFWDRFHDAQELMMDDRFGEAVGVISELLREDPENIRAMDALAGALLETGDVDRALELYLHLIEVRPGETNAYVNSARILAGLNRAAEAEDLVLTAIELQPESADGCIGLGRAHLDQGRLDDAERWFRRALEIDRSADLAAAGLGVCLQQAGRQQEALAVLKAARERAPGSHAVLYNLAAVTQDTGDRQGALALFREAVTLDPEDARSWNNLGSLLGGMGRHQEASQCFDRAHFFDPENVEATFNLGAALVLSGQQERGLPLLEQTLATNPGHVQAARMRATVLESLGRVDEAIAAWRALMVQLPEAGVRVARLELDRGREGEARRVLEEAIRRSGQEALAAARRDPRLRELLAK